MIKYTSKYKDIRRGEVFYVYPSPNKEEVGQEQQVPITGRPALIVSNDDGNKNSTMCVVVYLTRQDKAPLPTHVYIEKGDCSSSTILCEHPFAVSQERVGEWIRTIPEHLMKEVDKALAIAIGIKTSKQANKEVSLMDVALEEKDVKIKELEIELEELKKQVLNKVAAPVATPTPVTVISSDISLIKLQSELDVYKHLYQDLLIKSLK